MFCSAHLSSCWDHLCSRLLSHEIPSVLFSKIHQDFYKPFKPAAESAPRVHLKSNHDSNPEMREIIIFMGVEGAQFRCEKTGFGLDLTRKDGKTTFGRFPFSVTASALQALSMCVRTCTLLFLKVKVGRCCCSIAKVKREQLRADVLVHSLVVFIPAQFKHHYWHFSRAHAG